MENFLCKQKIVNNHSIPSTHTERQTTNLSVKHSFTPYPSLSPYRQNYRQRNKYTCCAWAGGTFFLLVVLCQFLVLAGIRFQFYILMYLEYNTVVALCQFLGSGGKQFLVLCTYLVYNTVVQLCWFFGCGGKQISKCEHVSTKKSYWVSFFYYCVSFFCIVKIYILKITIISQKYRDLSVQVEIGELTQYSYNATALQSRQFLKNIKTFYSLTVTIFSH